MNPNTPTSDSAVESHALTAPDLDEILVGAEAVGVQTGIVPGDLSDPTCRCILEMVIEHRQHGRPISLASIASSFQERGDGAMVLRLAECFDAYAAHDDPDLKHYSQRVKLLARVRDLRAVLAPAWHELGRPGDDDLGDLVDRLLPIDTAVFTALELAREAAIALDMTREAALAAAINKYLLPEAHTIQPTAAGTPG